MKKKFKPYFIVLIVLVVFSGLFVYANDRFNKQQEAEVSPKGLQVSSNQTYDDHLVVYKHKQYVSYFSENQARSLGNSIMSQEQSDTDGSNMNVVKQQPVTPETDENITVNVWLQQQNRVETVQLEDYVLAVTLHEVPWSFQDEAVKAQMIAARTYIMYRLNHTSENVKEYDVTDSTMHQVYQSISESQLTEKEQEQIERFKRLLENTKGKVLTYEGKVIDALYFSTSNGKTESAEHYFNTPSPYLKSVDSVWDKSISPSYNKQIEYSYEDFFARLKQANILDEANASSISIEVLQRSNTNRILSLQINGQDVIGRQFRDALGLASTDFTWSIDKHAKKITFTSNGYGHGVGMSQWGAEGMAREGYTALEILQHYYTDIEIASL